MPSELRRHLVKILLFSPVLAILPARAKSRESTFQQIAECRYPFAMSFEEFTELSRQWTMPDFIPGIDQKFMNAGLLKGIDVEKGADFVRWTYHFKDQAAFEAWSQEAMKHQVFDAAKVDERFKYSFSYVDLSGPMNVAKSSPWPTLPSEVISRRAGLQVSGSRRDIFTSIVNFCRNA